MPRHRIAWQQDNGTAGHGSWLVKPYERVAEEVQYCNSIEHRMSMSWRFDFATKEVVRATPPVVRYWVETESATEESPLP